MKKNDKETRIVSKTGGAKGAKQAMFSRIPSDVLWELAEHYGFGRTKYADPSPGVANWQLGYDWSLSIDALQRHLHQYLLGEEFDEESGSAHLVAVIWHAIVLRWFQIHQKGEDTRSHIKCKPKSKMNKK